MNSYNTLEKRVKEIISRCLYEDGYEVDIFRMARYLQWSDYLIVINLLIAEIKNGLGDPNINGYMDFKVNDLIETAFPDIRLIELLSKTATEEDNWSSIPYFGFYRVLQNKEFMRGTSFVDIGCGVGDKVFLVANISNMKSTGIEINPVTYEYAIKKYYSLGMSQPGLKKYSIINKDAFEHDFSSYDRVYTFMPLKNRDKLSQLYRKVAEQLPKGAIWEEVYSFETLKNSTKGILEDTGKYLIKI